MVIAVERGLKTIKERLEQTGYKTVYADEYPHPPDAYVYAGRRGGFSAVERPGELSGAFYGAAFPHGSRAAGGVVEINASEKSFGEILAALDSGRRGNYFY